MTLAPFDRTPKPVAKAMLKLAKLRQRETLVDIGCGDGSILVEAGKMGAFAVGVEVQAELAERAVENARSNGVDHLVAVVIGDYNCLNLRRADVVTLYLTTEGNRKLLEKLRRELAEGARLVSHDFEVPSLSPAGRVTFHYTHFDARTLYLYVPKGKDWPVDSRCDVR